ncbi:MAG: NAD(+) synthase [Butyrivibrio sp.]
MVHDFVRCGAMIPTIKVADCKNNEIEIIRLLDEAEKNHASVIVFPELCLTGYTCQDIFLQDRLTDEALKSLIRIAAHTAGRGYIAFIGLPYMHMGKLYNVAAAVSDGRILGITPKKHLPNYSEFYEARHFTPCPDSNLVTYIDGKPVPFGGKLLYRCVNMPDLIIGAELCEDVWVTCPPSISHVAAGATLIVNCSASDETTGKDSYRRSLITGQSARLVCSYVYCNAGEGESTQDLVFGGQSIIAENGSLLSEAHRFANESVYADTDLGRIRSERRRITTFDTSDRLINEYEYIDFSLKMHDLKLRRKYNPAPFVPDSKSDRDARCEEILTIQAMGLKKRLAHTGCRCAVIGISGGLDSTLAMLVTVKAFDMLGIPRSGIQAVTMPCFGTTDRTYQNACHLVEKLGATLREINIKNAVNIHFEDIGHNPQVHDVTYENCQARERTQVLMDIANQSGGMVIGTGDMSELALGWATYNGDHMSMYGVNCSVPKTLVRHLVRYYADTCGDDGLTKVLLDVLDTPVSPELLPPVDGVISQKTEDLVGPYELHDFFLYYILRFGFTPSKVYRLARNAFEGIYDDATILKWLRTFYRRFFAQQFKRSCLPDGPKVGSVAVSPRGDLRMPSDASARMWLDELENL